MMGLQRDHSLQQHRVLAYGTRDGRKPHFHALQPGDYTVTVAFYSAAAEGWELASQQASVGVDKKTEVIFEFEL